MTTPKEWALYAIRAWSTSEEFPGHPFPGLLPCIELAVQNAVDEAKRHDKELLRTADEMATRLQRAVDDDDLRDILAEYDIARKKA